MIRRLGITICLSSILLAPTLAEKPSPTTSPSYTVTPHTVAELRDIQERVRKVVDACRKATVNVIVQGGTGSGVIVSEDGYILCAGHVTSKPGRDARITLSDGKVVSAKTLGVNTVMDSAILKIDEPGKYPFRPVGTSADLPTGEWVFALGHPLGLQPGRPPVLRIGRLLPAFDRFMRSDCTLVAGDSGGPLFDLDGNVIGIHSRIGNSTEFNMHTPVDTYIKTWDQLASGQTIGDNPRPIIGIDGKDDPRGFRVSEIENGGPADLAGILIDDLIISVNENPIRAKNDLIAIFGNYKPGDSVKITLVRGSERKTVEATLEAAPQG
jgi:serine protease Do